MGIDLYKELIKSGSSYDELPNIFWSILNIQNEEDNECRIWCFTAHLTLQKQIHVIQKKRKILQYKHSNWHNFRMRINGKTSRN